MKGEYVGTEQSQPLAKYWHNLNQQQLEALAASLAPLLVAGDVVFLEGDLGAGKSTFARALIRSALAEPSAEVPSPTYTLVQTYDPEGAPHINHYDLYRLSSADEVYELGMDEALQQGAALIEWPERLGGALEADLSLSFEQGDGPDTRNLTAKARPSWGERLNAWGSA